MIGAPVSVSANKADTKHAAGIARDAQGRTCDFGPHGDECPNTSNSLPPGSKSASGDNVTGFAILSPGEHYGVCEERGDDNHLACDVINESDLPNGYKQGLEDAKKHQFLGVGLDNHTSEFRKGYFLGYCSMNFSFQNSLPGFYSNCTEPIYPNN
jgi:hypothetical protein